MTMTRIEKRAALAFSVDREYDRDRAGDGVSRFGHYVRERATGDSYAWDLDGAADQRHEFAELVWRTATPPVMAPGYVRQHHRITSSRVYRSNWDGALLASVTLATPQPAGLTRLWHWRDWPTELEGDHYRPVDPYEEQIGNAGTQAGGGYALTTVDLSFPLAEASAALPDLPANPRAADLHSVAALAVDVLVDALNAIVGPVIDSL